MSKSSLLETAKITVLAFFLTIFTQIAYAAWLQPQYSPTADCPRNDPTCIIPINTSSERQIKSGELVSGYLTGQWLLVGFPQGANPSARIDVGGAIRLWDSADGEAERLSCTSSNAGIIRYKRSANVLQYCNGTSWQSL